MKEFDTVKEWNGVGVPPAGAVCEAQVKNGGSWRKYTVKFIGDEYMLIQDHISETPIKYQYWEFRPLKSKEQIEREEAIEEMRKDIMDYTGYAESLNELLISKGWRKMK